MNRSALTRHKGSNDADPVRKSGRRAPSGQSDLIRCDDVSLFISAKHLPTETPPADCDFRVRAAFARRQRMRNRLLLATLRLYISRAGAGTVLIDDVIRQAGVSRGTFYKYYDSVDDAVRELGTCMAREELERIEEVFRDAPKALECLAGGAITPLVRGAIQPIWARFTSRVDYAHERSRTDLVQGYVLHNLKRARTDGELKYNSIEAALDLLVGAVIETMRRSANAETVPLEHILDVVAMTLVGLGASPAAARRSTATAWRRLASHAPSPAWWKPLSTA
jgi:AcrR family transcriptional regulator